MIWINAMPKSRRPLYHDYQPPRLYRAGVTLRRGFLTGPAATPEEEAMKELITRAEPKG